MTCRCSVIPPPLDFPLLPHRTNAARDMRAEPDNRLQRAHACYMHLLFSHLRTQLFYFLQTRRRVAANGGQVPDLITVLSDFLSRWKNTVNVSENRVLRVKLEKTAH